MYQILSYLLLVVDIVVGGWCALAYVTREPLGWTVFKTLVYLIILTIAGVITYTGFQATKIEPTDKNVLEELEFKRQGMNRFGEHGQRDKSGRFKFFCSVCDSHVSDRSKHCKTCNRCVDTFDHHC